jgi:hypothetical protein
MCVALILQCTCWCLGWSLGCWLVCCSVLLLRFCLGILVFVACLLVALGGFGDCSCCCGVVHLSCVMGLTSRGRFPAAVGVCTRSATWLVVQLTYACSVLVFGVGSCRRNT